MDTPIIEESYEEAKRRAKELYQKIGTVWCPALNQCISFNRVGFQHLLQKERRFLPKSEQLRRFALLPYAKDIVGDYRGSIIYEERKIMRNREADGKIELTTSTMRFWAFTDKRDGEKMRLVIRQVDGGKKHFFSIFQENKKPTHKK